MLIDSWLKKLTARFGRAPTRPDDRRNACRLTLEPLESRLAPAVHIWTGTPNSLWSLSSNWTSGAPVVGEAGGVQLVFPASTSVDDIVGLIVDRISFAAASTVVLSTPLALNGSAAGDHFVTGNGVAVVFSGAALTLVGTQVQFNTDLNGSVTIQNSLAGPSGLRMVGAGLLQLEGTANYQGATQINSGTMVLKNAGNANNTLSGGSITVGDEVGDSLSAELRLLSNNQIPDTNPITIRSDGHLNLNQTADGIGDLRLFGGQVSTGAGELSLLGNVTAANAGTPSKLLGFINLGAANRTFTVSDNDLPVSDLIIVGAITGSGGLIKAGPGTLELAGSIANFYTGTTTVNAGVLALNQFAVDGAVSKSLVIGDSAGGAGTASVRLLQDNEIPDNGTVSIRSDGRLDLNGLSEIIGPLTLDGGHVTTGAGVLFLNGNVNTLTGSPGQLPSSITGKLDLGAADRTFTVTSDGAAVNTLIIDGVISGSGGLIKDGPGTLELKGSSGNSYTGTTTIADGTLTLRTNTADAGLSANIVIGDNFGSAESAVLLLTGSSEIPNVAAVTVKGDGLLDMLADLAEDISSLSLGSSVGGGRVRTTGISVLQIVPGGSITVNSAPTPSTMVGTASLELAANTLISVVDATGTIDIEMRISGTGGLIKDGPGTLELAGSEQNNYTGTTTVNDGVLALNNSEKNGAVSNTLVIGESTGGAGTAVVRLLRDNQIPDEGAVTIHSDGRLDLDGNFEDIGRLTLDGGSSATTGTGQLTLRSNVVVTVAGSSSPATITGRLSLGRDDRSFSLADGAADVDLQVDSIAEGIAPSARAGLIKNGAGRMVLTGTNTYRGTTTVNAGVLQVDGSQPASAVTLTGGTLGGGGTVGAITATGGTIAPGLLIATAPVVLHSGNLVLGAATFTPLISGTAGGAADQIAVTGTVILAEATLAPIRTGLAAAVGQTFRVIDNDAADPVVGTFAGLPEGAPLPVNGQTFVISYHGGDGNDVVLKRIANILITGPDAGAAPRVRVFDAETQAPKFNFLAFPASFKGGVRVASADVNRDGFFDIVAATGPGATAQIKVFSGAPTPGQAPALLYTIKPYGNAFKGGAFVAVGDVNGDGIADIITGPGAGVAPTVKVFSGVNGALLSSFPAFPARFKGGVTVAAGDVNGDGKLDIIAGMGSGSQPRVRVFDAATRTQLTGAIGSFLAYPASFKGGVFVAAGDLNGDGSAEVITGPGIGTAPFVKVFTPTTVATPRQILAYPPGKKRGLRVGTADVNGDGKSDILTALGLSGSAEVRAFNDVSAAAIDTFFAEAASFKKGLFVAGSRSR